MGWRQSLYLVGLETRLATGGCPPVPTSDNWVYHRPGTSPFRCKLHLISAYTCMSTGNRAIIHSPGFRIMTIPWRGSSNSNNRLLANARNTWGPPLTYPLQFLSLEKAALLIHFDLTTPGYKYLVMKEKKNKGNKCGEVWEVSSQEHHLKNYPPPYWSTAQASDIISPGPRHPLRARGRKHNKDG